MVLFRKNTEQVRPVRKLWIDVYKGLAILMIVLSHAEFPYTKFVFLFHVPAFFFISGLSSSFERYSFISFIRRRAGSLILPFFIFNTGFIAGHWLVERTSLSDLLFDANEGGGFTLISAVNKMLILNDSEVLGSATWFLPTLFLAHILSYVLINKIAIKTLFKRILMLGGLFMSTWFIVNRGWALSYNLDLVFIAMIFVITGYLFRHSIGKAELKRDWIWLAISLALLLVLRDTQVNIRARVFDFFPISMLAGFAGAIVLTYLSQCLIKYEFIARVIAYMGRGSLWILAFHFLGFKLFHLGGYLLGKFDADTVSRLTPATGNEYWLPITVWSVVFSLFLLEIQNRLKRIINGVAEGT